MASSTFNPRIELLELPDCAGLTKTGRCAWLNIAACQGAGCPFRRTNCQLRKTQSAVYSRLTSLDEPIQKQISMKYYGGKRPWIPYRQDLLFLPGEAAG